MTTAMLEKRVTKLEAEIRQLKAVQRPIAAAKQLPPGLRRALRELEEGKIIGPFNSPKEFMVGLKK